MSYEDRYAVVATCRYVDVVVPQRVIEKDEQLQKLDVDIFLMENDWWNRKVKGNDFWSTIEEELLVYLIQMAEVLRF